MAAVSNSEISEVHKVQLEITIANVPCHHSNCAHKKHIYILVTAMFFFHLRVKTIHFEIRFSIPTNNTAR